MSRFLDDEAELGSDDEDNDDERKKINRNDLEEDEDGMDDDLADFVAGDDEVIGDENSEMIDMHNREMARRDEIDLQRTLNNVLNGHRKRKYSEVEGLESEEQTKRKIRRLNTRIHEPSDSDDDEGFGNRNVQITETLRDEEELSDEEIQKQLEQKEFYKYKKGLQKINKREYDRLNSLKSNQAKEED
jgi:hypothetical protein